MTRINQEMRWIFFLLLTIYFVCHTLYASQSGIKPGSKARIVQDETGWVDSVMQTMTTDEKIGQLFMIRAFSNKGSDHTRAIKELIKTYKIGGLCFFQGSAEEQIKLTNEYQQLSKIPLMVSMDAEWGPAMRLKQDFIDFPRQMTMGAIRDNRLIFQFGKEVARELLRMGVQIDFAPSIDINNNAANPVIGSRSFGENKYLVAQKGYMYMLGLQSAGVMACAKHFPGHGDTNVDSHFDVPVLPFDSVRLESLEMYPFKVLINQGVQSVMIGHLAVPGIDHDPKLPASLSHRIITHWLKDKLQFDGLIFTDALEMQGVTKNFEPGDIEVKAIQAGVDVLLLPSSITSGVKAIRNAVKEGDITIARLDESVRKILVAKYRFGLTATPQVATAGLEKELITGEGKALKQKIIEEAITMVKNENMMIPVQDITQDIATLALGYTKKAPFQERVDSYCKAHHFFIGAATKDKTNTEMMNSLAEHKTVIIGVLGMNSSAKDNYNISSNNLDFINQLSQKTKVILIAFGSPYSLKNFITPAAVLCAYGDDPVYQSVAIQAVFGGIEIKGRLPVTVLPYTFESGLETGPAIRVGYTEPEAVGMSSEKLRDLDKLADDVIKYDAAPGCEMVVIKDNKVVYNRGFGHYTYSAKSPSVNTQTVYDLASVTKVAATTVGVMKLYEEGKVDIYDYLGNYLPYLKGSNKEFMIIRDVMAHRAGLYPWIPFYESTVVNNGHRVRPSAKIYDSRWSPKFGIKVANRLYMDTSYLDTMKKQIARVSNLPNTNYRYSDLGFIMLSQVVKRASGEPLNIFMDKNFYEPMGLSNMGFLPLQKIPENRIAPTEDDRYFRQQILQGEVHDMAAAMMGGVSGHAGLFSNALNLGVLMQMLLNKGTYGGTRYLKPETIKAFTSRHPLESRRGIGFDMPQTDWSQVQNVTAKASRETFGHIGFTGTAVWADPQHDLVSVFLSNRTYPNAAKNVLERRNYRMKAHAITYDAIKNYIPVNYSVSVK